MEKVVVQYAAEQYQFVRESRSVLLDYCATISAPRFVEELSSFGSGGSIRNVLVHIANTYQFWVAGQALNKAVVFTIPDLSRTITDVIAIFDVVDLIMNEFIRSMMESRLVEIHYEIDGVKNSTSAFRLFTHVITHEFHHKGQILSMSRHLGYLPVDTDIIR